MKRRRGLRAAGWVLVLPATLACRDISAPLNARITAGDAAAVIEILAHDTMRGRMTGSPELRSAAAWVAGEFARLGLRPAGADDRYIDVFRVERRGIDSTRFAIRGSEYPLEVRWSDGVAVAPTSPARAAGALLVLGGAADLSAASDWSGRVVLLPIMAADAAQRRAIERQATRLARERRASALVFGYAFDGGDAAVREQARRFEISGPVYEPGHAGEPARVWASPAVNSRLTASGSGGIIEIDAEPVVFDPGHTPNVLGLIPGARPEKGTVLILAHLDAQGTTERAGWESGVAAAHASSGDSILNGADDNASGVAAMLEVAAALAADTAEFSMSILFLATGGEESGLLGASHFLRTSPHAVHIQAVINLDMIGRNHPDRIHVIGAGRSRLGELAIEAAHANGELAIEALPPQDEQQLYGRSDHAPFADAGIPSVWFFAGLHPDYHTVADHAEYVNSEKVARVARAVATLIRRLAQ